jgi:predicted O-methyltransferase YrrM
MQIGDDQAVLMEMLVTAVRSLNDAIVADPRVKVVLIPVGDGVSFVQKLGERQ